MWNTTPLAPKPFKSKRKVFKHKPTRMDKIVLLPFKRQWMFYYCYHSSKVKGFITESSLILIEKIRNQNWKDASLLLMKWKIVYLIITRKLHGLAPKCNLKQKYITLISSYNLKREDYKEKHNLLTLDLNLDARLQN